MAADLELTPTHHLVLFCAWDGLQIATLVTGMDRMIASGERFTLVPPIPPEEARQATLELLEASAIRVSLVQFGADQPDRWLSTDEARAALTDPATWALKGPRKWNFKRGPAPGYVHEIVVTPAGEELYRQAHELFGQEMDRTMKEAEEREAEFLQRHPDFAEKSEQRLAELVKWVEERGRGRKPKPPPFD